MSVRNCAICGKEFNHQDHRVVTCCDPECMRMRKVMHNRERRKIKAMAKLAALPVRYCPICGTNFKSANPAQKTCGDPDCMREHLRIYEATKKQPKREQTCPICGTTYMGRINQRTCGNRKCYDKLYMIEAEANGYPTPKKRTVIYRPNVPAIDTMPCPWASKQLTTPPSPGYGWNTAEADPMSAGWSADGVWFSVCESETRREEAA